MVSGEHLVHQGEGGLVGSQGAVERVAAEGFDPLAAADDDPGLGAAEELVAGETDQVGAIGEEFADRGFGRQAPATEVVQAAGALIDDEGQLVAVCRIGELGGGGFGREADDPEVGLVGHEDGGGVVADGALEVGQMGPVGAADLDESAARGRHHVRQAERTADLDELSARDDDLPAHGVGAQDQKQRGGVVVDHHSRFGAADRGDALAQRGEALSPPAGGQVELQGEV